MTINVKEFMYSTFGANATIAGAFIVVLSLTVFFYWIFTAYLPDARSQAQRRLSLRQSQQDSFRLSTLRFLKLVGGVCLLAVALLYGLAHY